MIDLNAVELFVRVVQAGSLSEASRRTQVPLATLSRKVKELEKQLGSRLFERNQHGMKLTEAGQHFTRFANLGLTTLYDGIRQLDLNQQQSRGVLRLSLPPDFLPLWSLLEEFQLAYPNIEIRVINTGQRLDLVEENIDVAVRVGAVIHDQMVGRHLLAYRHILVASPGFITRYGTIRSPKDILLVPHAAWQQGTEGQSEWRLGDENIALKPCLTSNGYLHLKHVALAGQAITELPPFLASEAIKKGELLPLLPYSPLPEQKLTLLYSSRHQVHSTVRACVDFCLENFQRVIA